MHFNTRFLLAITAWAALNYAMAFTIPPNLLAFLILQFAVYTAVAIAILLPLFLKLKFQKFSIAFSITAIGLLAFSLCDKLPNPIAGSLTQFVFNRLGVTEIELISSFGYDYVNGVVGKWYSIYFVFEIHSVLALGALAGFLWHKLGNRTPIWLVGLWLFLWAISISKEASGVGTDWSPVVGYFLLVVTIFLLPGIALFDEQWRPFSMSFTIAGCLGCLQLQTNQFGPPVISNTTIASTFPNMPASVGEHVVQIIVVVLAVFVGTAVQVVTTRYAPPTIPE